MSKTGEVLRLGPFSGGLNNVSDTTATQDNELIECVNFDVGLDGALISRPPMFTLAAPSSGTTRMVLLGYYTKLGVDYLLGSNSAGIWIYSSSVWTLMTGTATLQSTCMVQYDDKAWIVGTPGSAVNGGKWDGTTFTAVAAMPRGESATIHKERMWIVPGASATSNDTILRFSDAANLDSWPSINAIAVGKGDGQKLTHVVVFNDQLMLFKQDSTYQFAFEATPTTGVNRRINSDIGAANKFCVSIYENQLYVLHEANVYEVFNLDFTKLNVKVKFVYSNVAPGGGWADYFFLSIVADRLFIRYYAKIYIFNLKTKAWTTWETVHYPGPWIPRPVRDQTTVDVRCIAGAAGATQASLIYAFENVISSNLESNMTCTIKTKDYDMDTSHKYKKLFWWGIDLSTQSTVTGIIYPVIVSFGVTWNELGVFTWDQLAGSTWDQPLETPSIIQVAYGDVGATLRKRFVKFPQTIRFKQVAFGAIISNDGNTVTAPARVFAITALYRQKQTVSEALT